MIGLVGKDIKNIIITHDFHTFKKLQKKMNKLSRGMELDRERKKYSRTHTAPVAPAVAHLLGSCGAGLAALGHMGS